MSDEIFHSKYISIVKEPRDKKRKTDVYAVFTGGKEDLDPLEMYADLGKIHWYSAWRRYIFTPYEGSYYDAICLRDIAGFIEKLMEERKARKP